MVFGEDVAGAATAGMKPVIEIMFWSSWELR